MIYINIDKFIFLTDINYPFNNNIYFHSIIIKTLNYILKQELQHIFNFRFIIDISGAL